MNRLIIIGNGFDLAHGLKTSYADFINWYWEQRKNELITLTGTCTKDCLCEIRLNATEKYAYWINVFLSNNKLKDLKGIEFYKHIVSAKKEVQVILEPFFQNILKCIESKGWVDIENEYYTLLKENKGANYTCKELNNQLLCLQKLLIEYLSTQKAEKRKITYQSIITEDIKEKDISNEGKERALLDIESRKDASSSKWNPESIMMLSFNYTPTVKLYSRYNIEYNFIHGTLEKPDSIIFGFGDELDKDYKELQEANDNELLTNVKSVKYLEAPNYRDLLRFIESAPFQVLIMGHSCGLSDRTLLNTIFEHNNCVSIKPFYYVKEDGTDNYLELVQNISRNFTDMKLFRDRVVNKTQCEQM